MANILVSDKVAQALEAAGFISHSDKIRRIVIDLQAGHAAVMHIERYVDEPILDVISTLDGIQVRTAGQV